jgi:peptidoglycan-N-acetylglucosamine deacetylase
VRSRVLEPPYVYRWAVLLMTVTLFSALVLHSCGSDRGGAAESDRSRVAHSPVPAKKAGPVSADLIRRLPTRDPVVALTFDDGPHPAHTPRVLDLLAEHHAVATFCMVGTQVRAHPDLVREVVDAGMRLCNHTIRHDPRLSRRPVAAIEKEMLDASGALRDAAGDDVPIDYFRAPGGNWTPPLERTAARHGMRPLGWSVDPRDWSRPGTDKIVAAVERNVRPGSVILLHDGGGQRAQTVAALARLLPRLADRGYRFDFPA